MGSSIEIQDFPLWEKVRGRRIPLSFDIEATVRCNNDCAHCYINLPAQDRAARENELTLAEIARIAGEAAELGALWCLITGGEPLLRPDFSDIYMVLKRKGLLVSVFTNATLVNAGHVELFRNYPPRDLEVTVYGVTKASYEAVSRVPGSFEAFRRGLDMLLAAGVPVRLKAMAIRSNLAEQGEIAAFCRSLTKDYFRFDPQLHLRLDGNQARNRDILAERLGPDEIVRLEASDAPRIESMKNNCDSLVDQAFTHYGCNHLFHCGAGNGSFVVSSDGRFRLCASLAAAGTTCDLRTTSLREAWTDFAPRVRDLRSDDARFKATCRKCALVNLCLWCPAHAHLETGAMDGATPYFCEVAHARAAGIGVPCASLRGPNPEVEGERVHDHA